MIQSTQREDAARWNARYREGSTPWDRGIVAPEVLTFANQHPGLDQWALDIGCGTGNHSREFARNGYRVVGIDFSHIALQRALTTARVESLRWAGVQASAANLDLVDVAVAVALDVGCFHGMNEVDQLRYATALNRRLAPGGHYLLYAAHPRADHETTGPPGVNPATVIELFGAHFELEWRNRGWHGERRSDWWLWRKARLESSP